MVRREDLAHMPKTPRFTPTALIEILAFNRVQLLDVAGPLQVFASANDLASAAGEGRPYDPVVVAQPSSITTSAGLRFAAERIGRRRRPPDTLIVAGGFGVYRACENVELVHWIKTRSAAARRVASVCSGAYLLATAGLLDGRKAVTHWSRCGDFARRFPRVRVDPNPIYVQDDNVWTSAGITAGVDLALAFVEADLGRAAALAVARQLVVFLKRPGGQAQFSAALELQHGDARFERLHAWIASHLTGDLSVTALAAAAGMSERSFVRHYRRATGWTPARAVEQLRVEAARRMLEDGRAAKTCVGRCGFGSDETMRRSFLRSIGTTPQRYRERFAAAAGSARWSASPRR
jgi:transcriptional regulator GlxA family with amidase domain